jgi:hypothetical protein
MLHDDMRDHLHTSPRDPTRDRTSGPFTMRGLRGRQREGLLIAGLALLTLLLAVLLWNDSGARGARRDLRSATQRIIEARNEVEVARQVLEQRLAELREAEAAAVAESERLDAELVREQRPGSGTVTGAAAGVIAPPLTPEERAAASLRRTDSALGVPRGAPPR